MREEYDFSGGIRGRFYESKKIPVLLRLDNDIVLKSYKKYDNRYVEQYFSYKIHLKFNLYYVILVDTKQYKDI